MPLHLQSKLLQVLQDYEVKPIGGENTIELDVRAIAATNKTSKKKLPGKFSAGSLLSPECSDADDSALEISQGRYSRDGQAFYGLFPV